jgi:hypothetical protein
MRITCGAHEIRIQYRERQGGSQYRVFINGRSFFMFLPPQVGRLGHVMHVTATEESLGSYSKVKSKAVPLHAMEALGGKGGIPPTLS